MADLTQALTNIVGSLTYALISAYIAVIAVYIGLRVFSSLTKNINEMEELKKGNIAVGAVLASIAVILGLVTVEPIKIITLELLRGNIITGIILIVIQLGTNIVIAVVTQLVIIGIFNELTKRRGLVQFEELKKGNIAIGIGLAGIIIMVGIILQPSSEAITNTVRELLQ